MKLFKCQICGNIVELIHNGGGTLVCCGQNMNEVAINNEETTYEKHIPILKQEGNKVTVEVGSITHPMIEEHYIEWISLVQKDRVEKFLLMPGNEPVVTFEIQDGDFDVYAYCNIHGLYKAK